MWSMSALSSLLVSLVAFTPVEDETGALFAELAKTRDRAKVVELWQRNPHEALTTIDEYLEGSLSMVEQARAQNAQVDAAKVREMHELAIFGATCADEAFGTTMLGDYATAFAGFDAEQQKSFRRGQSAHREARTALKEKNAKLALERATECRDLALPLGDWWGTAMGLSAMGAASEALGDHERALTAHAQAAQIYNALRLSPAEYPELIAVARNAGELGRMQRAKLAAERALSLCELLGDQKNRAMLRELLTKLEADSKSR